MEERNGKAPRARTTKGVNNGSTASNQRPPGSGSDNRSSRGNAAALAVLYDTAQEIESACQETLDYTTGNYAEGLSLAEKVLWTLEKGLARSEKAYGEAAPDEKTLDLFNGSS